MRTAILLLASATGVLCHRPDALHPREYYEAKFFTWMQEHRITLPQGEDFVQRLDNFIDNSDLIEKHNALDTSYTLGHNHFSHLTFEEFQSMYLGWRRPLREEVGGQSSVSRKLRSTLHMASSAPDEVNWVEKGAVTSVKDQGQCGSCFTFSATGAIEGAYAINTGTLMDLSMQQIVDCDDLDGGCKGGDMRNAFEWVKQNGGLCPLEAYPYESGESEQPGACHKCKAVSGTAPVSWTGVEADSSAALMTAIAKQPVSVAVAASRDWMFYKEGVFKGKCEAELNHGVLAVGYGSDDQGDYWIVKNSWGPNWGDHGFIRLNRDSDGHACGILEDASYPTLGNARSSVVLTRSSGTATGKDCGGATSTFDSISFDPPQVHKNQLITMKADGILNKPTVSGGYSLAVKYAGSTLYSHSGNVCGSEKVSLPLGAGTINLYGLECPANPGPVSYGLDVTLPSIAPSGSYDIKLTAKDQDEVPLVCIDVSLDL